MPPCGNFNSIYVCCFVNGKSYFFTKSHAFLTMTIHYKVLARSPNVNSWPESKLDMICVILMICTNIRSLRVEMVS